MGPRRQEHPGERHLGRAGAHPRRALDRGVPDDGVDRRGARAAPSPHRRRRRRSGGGVRPLRRRTERDRHHAVRGRRVPRDGHVAIPRMTTSASAWRAAWARHLEVQVERNWGGALLAALRPSPRVPMVAWSARDSRWRAPVATLAILASGLVLFGIGEGALVAAGLGNAPWTVLAQGVARQTPLDIGGATIVISAVVLLGWLPLRQAPGLGTIANVVVIGLSLDVAARVLPHPASYGWQLLQAGAAIAIVGLGSAFYLTANLGPGPRDGWMTGIHRRSGIGIATVRTSVEVLALVVGVLLGGHAGIATIAFAVLVGYVLAGLFRVLAHFAAV